MNWKYEIIFNLSHKGQPEKDQSRDRLKVNTCKWKLEIYAGLIT